MAGLRLAFVPGHAAACSGLPAPPLRVGGDRGRVGRVTPCAPLLPTGISWQRKNVADGEAYVEPSR